MAQIKKISTELQLLDKFLDTSGDAGTSGQVLTSTGTGINWVSGGSLPGGPYLPLSAGSSYPLTGILYAGQGVKFTGGTIASATTVLHTNNVIYSRGGSGGMFLQNADGSDGMFIANDHVRFETSSTEKLRITSSGNVGIGTTTPGSLLTLNGSGQTNNYSGVLRIYNTYSTGAWGHIGLPDSLSSTTNSNNFYLIGRANNYTDRIMSFHIPTDGDYGSGAQPKFGFYSTGSDLLHSIEAETGTSYFKGNVGIGTTSPNHKLDIYSNENVPLRIHRPNNSNLDSAGAFGIGFSTRGDAITSTTDTRAGLFSYYNGNLFLAANNTRIDLDPDSYARLTILNTGSIKFNAYNSTNKTGTATYLLGTDANGNVVKTLSTPGGDPGPYLPLAGGTLTGGLNLEYAVTPTIELKDTTNNKTLLIGVDDNNAFIRSGVDEIFLLQVNGGDTAITMLNNSNVGINTTTPQVKLEVKSSAHSQFAAHFGQGQNNSAGVFGGISLGYAEANTAYRKVAIVAQALGDGAARQNLHFLVDTANDGGSAQLVDTKMMIDGLTGNVGIGTTLPGSKLTVNGQVQVGPDAARRYALQPSNWGYNTSYRTLILGSASTSYNTNDTGSITLAFGVDVSANTSGSFTGDGSELIFRNGAKFITPNAANTGYNSNTMVLKDGNVGIGTASPHAPLQFSNAIVSRKIVLYEMADNNNQFYGFGVEAAKLVYSTANTGDDHVFYAGASSTSRNELIRIDGSNGDIELSPSSRIVLDDTPTASTASGSGTIVKWSVSDATTAGTLYTVKTNGAWTPVDADNEATSIGMLAIALGTNANQGMLLQGFFYKASHGFTIGLPLYISNTAGAFTTTRPTGSNDYVRIIGYATSTNYIYFDPDKTWVQVA